MTFEEKFPSLKTMWDKNVKKRIFYREEVQENCLDKFRVKIIIDKYLECDKRLHNPLGCKRCKILKDLGE